MANRFRIRWAVAGLGALGLLGAGVAHAAASTGTTHTTATTTGSAAATNRAASKTIARTTVPIAPRVRRPVAPKWHFEGRHSGIEHFIFKSSDCAELDHHLDEIMTLI